MLDNGKDAEGQNSALERLNFENANSFEKKEPKPTKSSDFILVAHKYSGESFLRFSPNGTKKLLLLFWKWARSYLKSALELDTIIALRLALYPLKIQE